MANNGRGMYIGRQFDVTINQKLVMAHSKAFRTTGFKRWTFGWSLNESAKPGGKAIKQGILDLPEHKKKLPDREKLLGPSIQRVELALNTISRLIPTVDHAVEQTREYITAHDSRF